ncbi:MAG: hypothetical protein KDA79_24905, partial [Planctomycetaceae bacterium]|nr:hypothetical protein [Planctomycetaceae bacterium]
IELRPLFAFLLRFSFQLFFFALFRLLERNFRITWRECSRIRLAVRWILPHPSLSSIDTTASEWFILQDSFVDCGCRPG